MPYDEFIVTHYVHIPSDYRREIREILMECDGEFVPPLSKRSFPWQTNFSDSNSLSKGEDGISSYMSHMEREAILVMTDADDKIVAFLAYKPEHVHPEETDNEATDYVSTICVRHGYRGHGLAERLYGILEQFATHDTIVVKTWSTNAPHMSVLGKMGYMEHKRIANDRGEGIDTIYFRRNLA